MLSLILADVAEQSPARIRTGALLGRGRAADSCSQVLRMPDPVRAIARPMSAPAYARPQACTQATASSNGAQVAAQAESVWQQPNSNVKFAHKTRIATRGGGSLGPHLARDPV
jgi:hypothetical protein